ncbi:MAG TPA: hypothetical protein PLB01_10870 [Thermoanaerobaculia bacterium]|nr:hypothetical protein [Thermoanaerobaculia bacterium]
MAEEPVPPAPAPLIPKLPTTLPFEDEAGRARRDGCLKWGLVGCAGASVVLIVGMLFVLSNAKKLMGLAFEKIGDQVVAAAGPEVTPAEKERFRTALTAFAERAKAGTAKPAAVQTWQSQVTGALADGRVTGDEMRSLTVWLETSGAAPPPAPAK